MECYTDMASAIRYEHGLGVALEDVVGFSTLEEAVSDWWEHRPDRFRDPEEPLTRSPIEDNKVAFRDERGNAQLLLLGEEFGNGLWAVGYAENCYVPPTFMPRLPPAIQLR